MSPNFDTKLAKFLVTDTAPYMCQAGRDLQIFFSSLIHVTCLAHALHWVCETIRDLFSDINSLITTVKKVFLKANDHKNFYKECCLNLHLLPMPVMTCWGSWIEAALSLRRTLMTSKTWCSSTSRMTRRCGSIIASYWCVRQTADQVVKVLNGEEAILPAGMSPGDPALLKHAPLVSCGVERTFSVFKNIFRERQQSFTEENLRKVIVSHCFYNRNKQIQDLTYFLCSGTYSTILGNIKFIYLGWNRHIFGRALIICLCPFCQILLVTASVLLPQKCICAALKILWLARLVGIGFRAEPSWLEPDFF